MDKIWIISLILSAAHEINGQFDVKVELITKKYIEAGSSLTLYCRHNVDVNYLYKIAWLRGSENRFFEYIRDRDPPYRNFSFLGADIDLSKSNGSHVTLKNLDFDASDSYYCEVSIDNPIFTKASNEETIHIITKQVHPPKIQFKKKYFVVGDEFVANCTTSRAKPHPHITWLINGKKVDDSHTTVLHPHPRNFKYNRSKIHPGSTQSSMEVSFGKITNVAQDYKDHETSASTTLFNETDFKNFYPSVRSGKSGYLNGNGGPAMHRSSLDQFHRDMSRNSHNYGNIVTHHSDRDQLFDFVDEQELQQRQQRQPQQYDTNVDFYDNKYSDQPYRMRSSRNSAFNKIRRHLSVSGNNDVGNMNYDSMSASTPTRPIKNTMKKIRNYATYSSSELRVQVSELHGDANGRLEISCVSTIPAKVGKNEAYADFRVFSVRVDIKTVNPTTESTPPSFESKTAALGVTGRTSAASNIFNFSIFAISKCFFSLSIFYYFFL